MYSLNEKSDIYSVGVLLWEISSGQLPFKDVEYDVCLVLRIFQGHREKVINDTPDEYVKLYTGKLFILTIVRAPDSLNRFQNLRDSLNL